MDSNRDSAPPDREQQLRDRISYLDKELAHYRAQQQALGRVERAAVLIDPDAFSSITRVVSNLLASDNLDGIYRAIVHAIRDIWGFQRIGLLRIDPADNTLVHAYGFGLPQHYYDTLRIPLVPVEGMHMRACAARCVLEKRPLLVADRADDPDYNQRHGAARQHKEYSHQFLLLPLCGRDRVWGALTVATDEQEQNFLTPATTEILGFFANQATLAIENFHYRAEQQAAQACLRQYAQELEKSNRLKVDFLNNMSHEMRTPLAPILGYGELLLGARDLAPEHKETVRRITGAASRLVFLIEDLMDLAQLSAGRIAMHIQTIDLHEVIAACHDTVQPLLWQRNLRLVLPSRTEPCLVEADANRSIQVLWNLLTNAIKFSPDDTAITVSLAPLASTVLLTVRDEGIGIAAEHLGIIFERFRQIDGSRTRQFGGVGLGLDLARTLMELQGGNIIAASDGPGCGSTFTATFRAGTRAQKSGSPTLRGLPLPQELDLAGRKVLLVEDDSATLEMLTMLITEVNGDCAWCTSGAEALAKYRVLQPDLVILDIALPDRDGFAILDDIRATGSTVPCLALTAFATAEVVDKLTLSTFDNYLFKPFALRDFYRTLALALRR